MIKLIWHKDLTLKSWQRFTPNQQIMNVLAECLRAKNALRISDARGKSLALERALELIDLTVEDKHSWTKLGDILRLREKIATWYIDRELESMEKDIEVAVKKFGT